MGEEINGDFELTYVLHGIFDLSVDDEIEFKLNSALAGENARIHAGSTFTIEKIA